LIIKEFLGVYGAGLPQASKWVAQGYRSLKDVHSLHRLSHDRTVGFNLLARDSLREVAVTFHPDPQASKWVAQGYRSLKDLLERAPLTKQQRIGVERHSDFAQRIPRKEVEAHGAIVRKAVQAACATHLEAWGRPAP
jgi:hypothetical protein